MAAAIRVDVVSPEKVLFSCEATQVINRTLTAEVAFLAGHAPFLGALAENHTRIYLADGTIQDVAVHRGFVEVSHDTVSILSAVVLYLFATGSVKGFGFALGLSTLIDLAVLFWFTKPALTWLGQFRIFNSGHRYSGLSPETLGLDAPVARKAATAGGNA